jgi:hypothetical protein
LLKEIQMSLDPNVATPEAAETARRMTRRIVFMSKGLMMAAGGAWMCLLAASAWLAESRPATKPYVHAANLAAGLALAFLNVGIERVRARKGCHVRTFRQGTAREHLTLAVVIVAGVGALVALNLLWPSLFEHEWIGASGVALLVILFGGYCLVWARRCGLFELALLGAGLIAACGVAFCFGLRDALSERGGDLLLFSLQGGLGALLLAAGLSLHGRWTAWRARILATAEQEPS